MARRRAGGPLGDDGGYLLSGAGRAQGHALAGQGVLHEVHVAVGESGQQRPAAQVNDLRLRPAQGGDVGWAAHGQDAVAGHGHGFRPRPRRVHGVDAAVGQDQISVHSLHLCLRWSPDRRPVLLAAAQEADREPTEIIAQVYPTLQKASSDAFSRLHIGFQVCVEIRPLL